MIKETEIDEEHIHMFFGLSYAQYLVVPRTALQSMPNEWQRKFVELMEELGETIDWMPEEGTYRVQLMTTKTNRKDVEVWDHEIKDPVADYERGRRRLTYKHMNSGPK